MNSAIICTLIFRIGNQSVKERGVRDGGKRISLIGVAKKLKREKERLLALLDRKCSGFLQSYPL